jgi:hypothetical protein
MNFGENYPPALMICKIQLRLCELGEILLGFKVEIERIDGFANSKSKSGLANLTWAKQRNGRGAGKSF